MFNELKVIQASRDLLDAIYGEWWREDSNFKGTPGRMMRSYREILGSEDPNSRTNQISKCFKSTFPSEHNSIIFAPNIKTHSMCPHHMLPVSYTMTIAYLPKEKGTVLGASKLERVARILSARAVLQEDLTVQIARTINEYLVPEGVAVVTSGVHDCMRCRGIKSQGTFELSHMIGAFKDNPETRSEFFSLMQLAEMRRK